MSGSRAGAGGAAGADRQRPAGGRVSGVSGSGGGTSGRSVGERAAAAIGVVAGVAGVAGTGAGGGLGGRLGRDQAAYRAAAIRGRASGWSIGRARILARFDSSRRARPRGSRPALGVGVACGRLRHGAAHRRRGRAAGVCEPAPVYCCGGASELVCQRAGGLEHGFMLAGWWAVRGGASTLSLALTACRRAWIVIAAV